MNKTLCKTTFSFLLAAVFTFFRGANLAAENFSVTNLHKLNILPSLEKSSVWVSINDAVEVSLPENMTYIQGIEISFKIPNQNVSSAENIYWSFYKDSVLISEEGQQSQYTGYRIASGTFASPKTRNIKIPLIKENNIKTDAFSYCIPYTGEYTQGKFIIKLQNLKKGSMANASDFSIEVSGKPIFMDQGTLFLSLRPPSGTQLQPCIIFVDGISLDEHSKGIKLSPGIHELLVTSDHYRNEIRTFTVEKAQNSYLEVSLRDIAPSLRIIAPEGTKIFLDEQPILNRQQFFTIQDGEHLLRMKLGGYEIVRTLSAEKGHSYTLSLTLEASVTEEE